MTVDVEYYVEVIKRHEQQRLSTTERQKFWEDYKKQQVQLNEVK